MLVQISKNIILNVSVLVLIAYLLTRLQPVKELISSDSPKLYTKIILAGIFGAIGILSTYTGISVQGAIANTRVIGVIAGGILGGPFVGLGAGVIAGLHRWAIDIGGFTATACAVSTIVEGYIGGYFSKFLKQRELDWTCVCGVTMIAEFCQMAIILLIARPIKDAWHLVQVISIPMIIVNSLGVGIFIGVFDSVFIEQDREASKRVRRVLKIADECLPYLRTGLYDRQNLDAATSVIMSYLGVSGVVVTDRRMILSCAGEKISSLPVYENLPLPAVVTQTITTGEVHIAELSEDESDLFYTSLKHLTAVCAPLTQRGEVLGTLVLFIRKFKLAHEVEREIISGLAKLFSTQLELAQVDYQKKLRRKAEFAALQSQINPHFLFNALSTITSFCREKPERARELLIVLSSYFRNTLQTGRYMISLADELGHVNAYLELEKARFEEKLQIEKDIPDMIDYTVPSFILQPIVENAVKHGAMNGVGKGLVKISIRHCLDEVQITVSDNGKGIPADVIERLYSDSMEKKSVGLANVHKRLKSIYGEAYGLLIDTSEAGTSVTMRIPLEAAMTGGRQHEICSD